MFFPLMVFIHELPSVEITYSINYSNLHMNKNDEVHFLVCLDNFIDKIYCLASIFELSPPVFVIQSEYAV